MSHLNRWVYPGGDLHTWSRLLYLIISCLTLPFNWNWLPITADTGVGYGQHYTHPCMMQLTLLWGSDKESGGLGAAGNWSVNVLHAVFSHFLVCYWFRLMRCIMEPWSSNGFSSKGLMGPWAVHSDLCWYQTLLYFAWPFHCWTVNHVVSTIHYCLVW